MEIKNAKSRGFSSASLLTLLVVSVTLLFVISQVSGTSPPIPDRCFLKSDTGKCFGAFPKWFYNKHSAKCEHFIYGGCQGNENRFDTEEECNKTCS